MATKPTLEVHNLVKHVGQGNKKITILQGIDLIVESAQTIALTGESGSGKSTLLSILAGLDDASSGSVQLLGQDLNRISSDERARLRAKSIGFVFQAFMLIPSLNALENVQLPALLRGESTSHSRQQAIELLTTLGLEHRLKHFPEQLSGGEQQRVALARAFQGYPRILFADEPTGNLDRKTGLRIADLLFSLNRDHATTLILVTHDAGLAVRCQRRLRLLDGKLQEEK